MRTISIFAGAFALSIAVGFGLAAQAAPKRVDGQSCHFPNVKKGTWVGFFDGWQETTLWNGEDGRGSITVWRCFQTKAECTAWKYWMQTDYRAGPQLTWCRKK